MPHTHTHTHTQKTDYRSYRIHIDYRSYRIILIADHTGYIIRSYRIHIVQGR